MYHSLWLCKQQSKSSSKQITVCFMILSYPALLCSEDGALLEGTRLQITSGELWAKQQWLRCCLEQTPNADHGHPALMLSHGLPTTHHLKDSSSLCITRGYPTDHLLWVAYHLCFHFMCLRNWRTYRVHLSHASLHPCLMLCYYQEKNSTVPPSPKHWYREFMFLIYTDLSKRLVSLPRSEHTFDLYI